VGSYPTVSPLPLTEVAGGLISVALSVGLPRPGVTRHRCLVESGLSSRALRPQRPSGPPRLGWVGSAPSIVKSGKGLRGQPLLGLRPIQPRDIFGQMKCGSGVPDQRGEVGLLQWPPAPWAVSKTDGMQQSFIVYISAETGGLSQVSELAL